MASKHAGRTKLEVWTSTDTINIYTQARLLLQELNSILAKPATFMISGIIFIVVIMMYNTIRQYHRTPLMAYLFYPITAFFLLTVGIVVGKEGQKIYSATEGLIEDFKRKLRQRSQTKRSYSIVKKTLLSLRPFAIEIGSFFLIKPGLTQECVAFAMYQTINLLLSFP